MATKSKPKKSRGRRICIAVVCLLLLVVVVPLVLPSCLCGDPISYPSVRRHSAVAARTGGPVRPLKVMTLNLAHGRKDGPNQLLRRSRTFRPNLDDAASVLTRERPDVVALQEADGPCFWSGGFDHVRYLAEGAGFVYSVRAEHVRGIRLSYGTALLSALDLSDPVAVTFRRSPPSAPKGFIACVVQWPGNAGIEVDVVSVHLDNVRPATRGRQVEEVTRGLSGRGRPLILMGDFNCEWAGKEPTLRTLAEKLGLRSYRPEAADMMTFPSLNKRLDWILISPELEFVTYEALPDVVSDHRGVVASLRMSDAGARP